MGIADKPKEKNRSVAAQSSEEVRTISSRDILGDEKLVIIRHEEADYRLQLTAAGKLILTK